MKIKAIYNCNQFVFYVFTRQIRFIIFANLIIDSRLINFFHFHFLLKFSEFLVNVQFLTFLFNSKVLLF